MVVYTIGHSTLALDTFLGLLAAHGIGAVADVRRYPASRRHPHFSHEALAPALEGAGRGYLWIEALGGRRHGHAGSPHTSWQSAAFRAYADHMDTPEFAAGLAALLDLAAARPTAIMCAEAVPWRCHRQLVADLLVARGIEVRHVTGPGGPAPHRLTAFARVAGRGAAARVVYDRGQIALATPAASRRRGDRP